MRGFNKELIINGEVYRSPEQQVYENMKNIKELQEKIKDAYKTSEALTSSSVSVALSNTNAPEGTTEGWLMTSDGLLFSITGGDDTNLLLEYYADLKGPQGEDGAALNIDDSTTSATKVWSSQKTNNEIGNKIQNDTTGSPSTSKTYSQKVISDLESSGIAWTATDIDGDSKVLLSVIYLGSQTALTNVTLGGRPKLKVDDLVVYVDGDLKAKTLYRVSNVSLDTVKATLVKVCDFGGGKKYYQHNIRLSKSNSNEIYNLLIQIPNSSSEEMDAADLLGFLNTNGYIKSDLVSNYEQNMYRLSGSYRNLSASPQTSKQFCGVVYVDSATIYGYILDDNSLGVSFTLSTMTIKDTVVEM